jgi:hypothetical protein
MSVSERTTTSDAYERSSMTVAEGLNFFAPQADLLGQVEELQRTKYLPQELIDRYLQEALKGTVVKRLETGPLFAEIPGFDGVRASDDDLGACVAQLREALFDWLVLKIEQDDRDIPVVAGISLNVL